MLDESIDEQQQIKDFPDGRSFYDSADDVKVMHKHDRPIAESIFSSSNVDSRFSSGVLHTFKLHSSAVLACTASKTFIIDSPDEMQQGTPSINATEVLANRKSIALDGQC